MEVYEYINNKKYLADRCKLKFIFEINSREFNLIFQALKNVGALDSYVFSPLEVKDIEAIVGKMTRGKT